MQNVERGKQDLINIIYTVWLFTFPYVNVSFFLKFQLFDSWID